MLPINPAYISRIKDLINASPFLKNNAIEVSDFGYGYSAVESVIQTRHLQAYGVIHGGFLATLIDIAAYWSVYCDLSDPAMGLVSVDLKLNFLAGAREGKVTATGTRIKLGKSLGYGMAEVRDEAGKILAHGTSTLMVTPDLFKAGDMPPKHLGA